MKKIGFFIISIVLMLVITLTSCLEQPISDGDEVYNNPFDIEGSDYVSGNGLYSFNCVDSEQDYASREINYGDFSLSVDFKMEECTWSGGIAFGLSGEDVYSTNNVQFGVCHDDGGLLFILSVNGVGSVKAYYDYEYGKWYTAILVYDWSSQICSLQVKDCLTGVTVSTAQLVDSIIPYGVSGLLIGNPGGDGIGSATAEIDNLVFTENGQTVYSCDFSEDPDWTVTDPTDLYRLTSSETYYLKCVESEGEYVYRDIDYGDFTLQVDVKINECTWSGGMAFGFWDSTLSSTGDSLFSFSNADGGKCIILAIGDGGYQKIFYDYTFGEWYSCLLSYDWDGQDTSLLIKERTTGTIVANFLVEDVPVPGKLSQLILGDPGGDGVGMVSGEIDNIIFTENNNVVYEESFSEDPGWTVTDNTDLYWYMEE